MMKRFVRICSKVKYLGLLGLPGFFSDNKLFDFLWLFWLFGLAEIFYNFPVFVQSLKQLLGLLIIPLRYGSRLPSPDNCQCKGRYALPFEGKWVVVNGGADKKFSHSWSIYTQRYAYDFIMLDDNGKSCKGDATGADDYYCYGKKIIAPADGEVIEVGTGCPDSLILGNGQVDCSARDIRGNYILIRHEAKEYSLLAHLQPNSICVKKGDLVTMGQAIARCGNSGNSSEPHLHFQLQDGTSFFCSAGLPITFENISVGPAVNYSNLDIRPIPSISEEYIARGQSVENTSVRQL